MPILENLPSVPRHVFPLAPNLLAEGLTFPSLFIGIREFVNRRAIAVSNGYLQLPQLEATCMLMLAYS